ncbi:hypothetical protein ACFU6I_45620, partial [Streptomyces sp. NPDC057486]
LVHGGPRLLRPTVVDDDVRAELTCTAGLAPLYMLPALTALDATRNRRRRDRRPRAGLCTRA